MGIVDTLPLTSLAESAAVLLPFMGYVLGMVVYTVFVFEFYRYMARRDMFELALGGYAGDRDRLRIVLYAVKYLFVFPTVIMVWYLIFTFLVTLLSGGDSVASLLVLTMAVVTTTRVTAYYNEDLSKDVAKTVPFSMLAVFVIDGIEALSADSVLVILDALPDLLPLIAMYWGLTVLLEFVLRIATIARFKSVETAEQDAPTTDADE